MDRELLILNQMKSKHAVTKARGFTLVELLVTITIVAVLAGFTLTMLNRGGVQSKLTGSLSRVRTLGPMVYLYSQDNGGRLPVWKDEDTYWWAKIADPSQFDPEGLFKSPNDRAFDRTRVAATISYGWNATVMGHSTSSSEYDEQAGPKTMANFSQPEKTLVLADGAKNGGFGRIEPGGPLPDPERYDGKVAALLLDGSARILNANQDFKVDSPWFAPEETSSESSE
jgi:prepilin-type N-terminal cleavage/methylation domain-containing protein